VLARDGKRRGSDPGRPYWRGTCQCPARPGSQDFDRRGHSASGRGASFWLVDADVLSRTVLSRTVLSRTVVSGTVRHSVRYSAVVRYPYGDADRHADAIGFPDRHADGYAVGFPDRHAVVFSHRHSVTQAVHQAIQADAQAQPQAIARSVRASEHPAVADHIRLA
jgi:hypothetical protein